MNMLSASDKEPSPAAVSQSQTSAPIPGPQRKYRVRFRHTLNPSVPPQRPSDARQEYTFAADQRWVRAPRSFNFIDETREIISIHEAENSDSDLEDTRTSLQINGSSNSSSWRPRGNSDSTVLPAPSCTPRMSGFVADSSRLSATDSSLPARAKRSLNADGPNRKRTMSSSASIGPSPRPSTQVVTDLLAQPSISGPVLQSPDVSSLALASPSTGSATVESPFAYIPFSANEDAQSLSHAPVEQPRWPLKDSQEAFLFQNFIREVAPMFDLCDNARQFAKVVPKRAPFCPPLLNAMLAAAAKRLSRINDGDSSVAYGYYQECLRTLIPLLSSSGAAKDENLLAATLILRYMEETDVAFSINGSQSHLVGSRVFLAAREDISEFSELRLALFWIALRQEIFMAFIHSRPVYAGFLSRNVAPVLEGAYDECSYANKVILHCAYCIQYCFGEQEQRPSVWNELSDYLDQWERNKPWSFNPMSLEQFDDTSFFPEMTYISDEVLTGMQHYYLARLVLEAHSPKTPRLGPARRLALEGVNGELRRLVRIVCGIAESNPQVAPGYVNAAVAIVMAGDRFTDRPDQELLHALLVKIEKYLAWPTGAAQIDLKNAWGWARTPDMSIAGVLNSGIMT
ncbi:hypothetical protein PFICI_08287 [Pestalotiopsis fici W106-1]|uniref:Uncharacterized protein n=1 Tax=Pestalotiopsis fici (strain W106-1 / CGMCC3.15140) TaxID=1229662 RepID=W3X3Q6_PESFW|nr:uncharacterized protein PFICI_08287 [Pestalotiopsis fici W106-1]ETS80758.1 hypothetical protein PFICI_08287 [Pestalotiopsis fici W106-1]